MKRLNFLVVVIALFTLTACSTTESTTEPTPEPTVMTPKAPIPETAFGPEIPEYIDQIYVFQFYPWSDVDIIRRHFEVHGLAAHVLSFFQSESGAEMLWDGFSASDPERFSGFIEHLNDTENTDNRLFLGSFLRRSDALRSAKSIEIQVREVAEDLNEILPDIRFEVMNPEKGTHFGVAVEAKLTDSQIMEIREVLSSVGIRDTFVVRPDVL